MEFKHALPCVLSEGPDGVPLVVSYFHVALVALFDELLLPMQGHCVRVLVVVVFRDLKRIETQLLPEI